MAKYSASLINQDTTTKLPPNFMPGFISDGIKENMLAQQSFNQALSDEKKQKYEREQALMDGVVSGHFSPEITAEVMDDISNLTGYNSNSKEYATALNKATAKLKVNVEKQAEATGILDRGNKNYTEDTDNKYYKDDSFFKFQEGMTNINLTGGEYSNGYKSFLGNVDNINQDLVREDFVDLIGTYSYGGGKSKEGEDIGGLKTITTSQSSGERTQFYKLENGISVPVFKNSNDVPQELVDKWYSGGKANMAMMDEYVADKLKGQTFANAEANNAAEVAARKEFLNDQMKQVIPDYKTVYQENSKFQPNQSGGGGGANKDANSSDIFLTTLARGITGDASMIGDRPMGEFNFENGTVKGFDITDQFQNMNLAKSGDQGFPASRVVAADGEDALYVDINDGAGLKKYTKDEFNLLVTLAAEADNGFTTADANKSQYYNSSRGAYRIDQFYKDEDGNTKHRDQMTDEDFSSGNWKSANNSLVGTDSRRIVYSEDNTNEARANQLSAAKSLNAVDGFSFDDMATSKDTKQINKYAKALNTAMTGKSHKKLGGGAVISSIEKGAINIGIMGAGQYNYVVYFADGREKQVVTGEEMATIFRGDVL